jgi:hypothetical protein
MEARQAQDAAKTVLRGAVQAHLLCRQTRGGLAVILWTTPGPTQFSGARGAENRMWAPPLLEPGNAQHQSIRERK